MRILLNDAVYPVAGCSCSPSRSCPRDKYNDKVLTSKWEKAGTFENYCDLSEGATTTSETGGVSFFTNLSMGAIRDVEP